MRIACGPEVDYAANADPETGAHAINQKCLEGCEKVIRDRPEYWLWSYKRWKARPTREQGRYPDYSRHVPH
jgi:lauroyl/myristoyl acyltransferase